MRNELIKIGYGQVESPQCSHNLIPIDLTKETMKVRLDKVCNRMIAMNLDVLAIYGDREHGGNFAYLTGFEPRFEEAVLVLKKDKSAVLMLGNENLKLCSYSAVKAEPLLVPHFSLPNQPMENTRNLTELFKEAGVNEGMSVGIVGWKLFTSELEDNSQLFDVPYFIVDAIKTIVGAKGKVRAAADLFIHPLYGARRIVNANEIAHYEFGAALASDCVLQAMNQIEPGKTEMEVADTMCSLGQPVNVTTICATGERFTNGVVFPRNKAIKKGDKFSLTMGLRGGLSSRSAYVAEGPEDLEESVRDYLDVLAKPYYKAAVTWYETVGIGVTGNELYHLIETVFPKKQYHWSLNPGHLTSDEEWMSSPIFPQSNIVLESGMMFQMDIIPGIPGYAGAGAEDGIVIANEDLQRAIRVHYPDTWERFVRRRQFMSEELGIHLKPEVLPMSDIAGYMRPYLLNKQCAFKVL